MNGEHPTDREKVVVLTCNWRKLEHCCERPDSPIPCFAHVKHQANRTASPCLEDTVSTTNVPFGIAVGAWKSQVARERLIATSFCHLRHEAGGLFYGDFAGPSLGCARARERGAKWQYLAVIDVVARFSAAHR